MAQILSLESTCEHCGTFFSPTSSQKFCCAGCEFVFGLIQGKGLGHYYDIRDANPPSCPLPIHTSTSTYDFCDDSEFIKKLSSDGKTLRFYIEGLNCTACLWLLEKLPDFCADAESARVDMATSTIEVRRKPNASFAKIAQTLNRFGYRPHPLRETEVSSHLQTRERRGDLIRIGIAGALTGNIMILAVSLYGGAVGPLAEQFRWLSGLLALPVLSYCAWPFYRSTFASLRSGHLNLDVPIVVAILTGIFVSSWGIFNETGSVYFDSLSMLVFLLLSSRFFLKGIQVRHLQSTNLEDELLLATVRRFNADGKMESVSSLSLIAGDLIHIGHECVIPVDGTVVSGAGTLNVAILTGESEPIAITTGSLVQAGSRHVTGEWNLKVTNPPAQTRLAQILRDTEKSAHSKPAFVHFSDHISNWFITIVLTCAVALVLFFISSNPHEGISRALALVIVTCPCVFGIAIPLSMSFAIRGAARQGIIVKNADAIERLWKVKNLFFDKTGTLTTGVMSILKIKSPDKFNLGIALGLEKNQAHPVARSIVRNIQNMGISEASVENIAILQKGGVSGDFGGLSYSLKPSDQVVCPLISPLVQSSYSLFREDEVVATFSLGDNLRAEARELLLWARRNDLTTRIMSGDRKEVVETCGMALGFSKDEIQYGMSPELKAETIRGVGDGTAMIGDGANDAAALAAAGVGIAVCGSLDVSLRSADVYLTRPDLCAIADLFEIAKLTKAAIYRNLFFSASFNVVSGALAASGMMSPLWAAVLMPVSSVTVLLSSIWTGNRLPEVRQIS